MTKKHRPKKTYDVGRTLPPLRGDAGPNPVTTQAGASPPPAPLYEDEGRPTKWKRVLLAAFLSLLALMIFIIGWDVVNVSRAAQKTFGSGNIFQVLTPTSLKGSDTGRVNVLLVGYSVDDPGHPGATLTDSIMLLSLSTRSHTGYILSIPRDLYVKIPGNDYGKINEVYKDGGMPLLEQIVSRNFNMPINYYSLVDYSAVRETVNALGGIWVNIQSPDPRGLYDPNISNADGGPLQLSNGWHKLNGQTALNLTRARGDPAPDGRISYGFPRSDFDRSQHQRQVLTAIKNKLSWTLMLNPLKNGRLFSAMGSNVKTDIKLSEARPLFGLFSHIPESALQSLSLNSLNGQNYLASYSSYYSGSALIPAAGIGDYSQINAALVQYNQN